YMFDDRIVVNFNYQEGGRPVSLEEVLSSFLDGNGAPEAALRKVNRPRLCRQHKKSPWAGIFSFSRSGAASAALLLFCFVSFSEKATPGSAGEYKKII